MMSWWNSLTTRERLLVSVGGGLLQLLFQRRDISLVGINIFLRVGYIIIQLLVLLAKFFKNLLPGIFCRAMFMLKEFACRRQQFRII